MAPLECNAAPHLSWSTKMKGDNALQWKNYYIIYYFIAFFLVRKDTYHLSIVVLSFLL